MTILAFSGTGRASVGSAAVAQAPAPARVERLGFTKVVPAARSQANAADSGDQLPPFGTGLLWLPAYLAPVSTAVKPELVIDVPKTFVMINYDVDYATQGLVPDPFFQPACAASDPATVGVQDNLLRSSLFAVSPTSESGAPYGDFGTFTISGLAFGALPVTATIHLQQHAVGNVLTPIAVNIWSPNGIIAPDGSNTYATCDPSFVPNYPAAMEITNATGQLDATITDITVDQQPVAVGPACRSSTPLQLNLFSTTGYYPFSGGELDQDSQISIDYQNPSATAPRPTDLTIPPFVGCGAGGDDLDPLINAIIAGPGNKMAVEQSTAGIPVSPDPSCDVTTSSCLPPNPAACDPAEAAAVGTMCETPPDYPPAIRPPA